MGYLNNIYKKRKKTLFIGDLVVFSSGVIKRDFNKVVGIYEYDVFLNTISGFRESDNVYELTMKSLKSELKQSIKISERGPFTEFCLVYIDRVGKFSWNRFSEEIKIKKLGEC
jgi:hypothetical protein